MARIGAIGAERSGAARIGHGLIEPPPRARIELALRIGESICSQLTIPGTARGWLSCGYRDHTI